MQEQLANLKEKSKGTLFEKLILEQIEGYQEEMKKKEKIIKINNKWIEQADELFNLFDRICQKYVAQFEPFVAKVEYVDHRESEARVALVVTNFKQEYFSLYCADMHTLEEYERLEDQKFVDSLDEDQEEGGIQLYAQPSEPILHVLYTQIFQQEDPFKSFEKKLEPLILDLFQASFDLNSLMHAMQEKQTIEEDT